MQDITSKNAPDLCRSHFCVKSRSGSPDRPIRPQEKFFIVIAVTLTLDPVLQSHVSACSVTGKGVVRDEG
jgi:hypothetical protein